MISLLLLLAGSASAQEEEEEDVINQAGVVQFGLRYDRAVDPTAFDQADLKSDTLFGVHGGFLGFDGTATYVDIDMWVGGGGGGFAWDTMLLIGPGSWVTDWLGLGVAGGFALGGIHRRLPIGFRIPVQPTIFVQGGPLTFELLARADYVVGNNHPRRAGTTSLPVLDEFRTGINIYVAKPDYADEQDDPNLGWNVGFLMTEAMGTRMFGGTIGFGGASKPENTPVKENNWNK